MIEVDATTADARARRRTWMLGGSLLTASALLELGLSSLQDLIIGLPFDITQVLFWAGAVVFAIGLGRAGSVTARRPLGTGVIIALAVWQVLAVPLVWSLTEGAADGGYGSAGGAFSPAMAIATSMNVISLLLAILAVVQVGRAGVVPRPWNWAPLWVLALIVVSQLLPNLLAAGGGIVDQTPLIAVFGLAALLHAAGIAFLGILAIVLAAWPLRGSTPVYGSVE